MGCDLFSRMQYEPSILLLGEKFDHLDEHIINFRWNMIVTTSCDLKLSAKFSKSDRMVIDIFDKRDMQANILDKKMLHIVRLLGKDKLDKNISEIDKEDLEDNALSLIQRIVSAIIRNGIIVFDYFDDAIINSSILRKAFKNLYSNQHQVYIFNYPSSQDDKYIKSLIEMGIATVYEKSFNEFFGEYFKYEDYEIEEIDDRKNLKIYLESEKKGIPTSIQKTNLLETESFATLLNIELINSVLIPEYMIKEYFYMFLKNSVREPQWYGFKYGFNLKRAYEDILYKKVKKGLENAGKVDNRPLLIVGQTGSGKSISLAEIAYKIFNEMKYPVIFINDPEVNFYSSVDYKGKEVIRKGASSFNALDSLLELLENKGAKATLVIWDTSSYSSGREKSYRLYQALLSRGRKVFMMSTAYEISNIKTIEEDDDNVDEVVYNNKFIECHASVELTDEIEQLKTILISKCKIKKEKVDYIIDMYAIQSQNFLSMLYQTFDILRTDLSKGVYKEANLNLKEIDKFLATEFIANENSNVFAIALKKIEKDLVSAGLTENNNDSEGVIKEKIEVAKDDFIKCIAVCSQFKLKMPYDFALRILGTYNPKIIRLLTRSTFFVISQDYNGNYEISIRTPLEAQMFLYAKNITIMDEIDSIKIMLKNMQAKGEYGQQLEVRLCEKLIRVIGPNNKEYGKKYKGGHADIINALNELREQQGIWEPILISQEITYMREYYGRNEEININERIKWLKKAINIADKMLMESEHIGLSMGTRNSVIVESANSKLLLCQLVESNDTVFYKEIRRDLQQVIQYDSHDYHAYVTLLKASLIEYDNEDEEIKRIELLEAMCAVADQIMIENIDVANSEYFQRKVTEIYSLLVDTNISQKYIDELAENGSAAGIYVQTRKLLLDIDVDFRNPLVSEEQYKACNLVYSIFNSEKYKYVVQDNEACQYMLLNVFWLKNNGEPIYQEGECWRTYLNDDDWYQILNISNNYLYKFCSNINIKTRGEKSIKYLKALSLAQLGEYSESRNVLKSIEEDSTIGLKRVYTKHMICEKNGIPRKFIGRLGKYDEIQRNGVAYIDEFGREGIYYHGPHLKTSKFDEGTIFTDLEVGLSNIAPRIFREIENG